MAEMRKVLAQGITDAMRANENVVLIDADLARANGLLGIRKEFPDRAFDAGIAEANMTSMAAGMASYGFIPFITSFTPFATRRNFDQVAISVCYANMNVKIVGTDPGIAAEINGGTHMSLEDYGIMRSLPGLVIYEAADCVQLEQALPQIIAHEGPVYLRIFRKEIADVFGPDYKFDLFKADVMKEGSDVTLLASGIMVHESLEAIKILEEKGIKAELINVHTIKPLDEETILASVAKTGCCVVAENHNVVTGLTEAVASLLSQKAPAPLESIGVKDHFGEVGKMPFLKEKYHMTAADIVAACEKAIARK